MKRTSTEISCHYCGEPCADEQIVINTHNYCCYGCATLDDVVAKITTSEDQVSIQYKQFDISETFDKLVDFQNEKVYKVGIDLPAIHCSSCVELLEDLPAFNAQVLSANVNFEQRRCTVVAKKELPLSFLAQLLDDIGYPPQLSISNKIRQQDKKRKRLELFKLVVAGFCFGNVMLYAMPHYFGLEIATGPFFSRLFTGLTVVMSFPVLFYSGRDYLSSAYKALMASRMHINVPIAIGMISLWVWSLYEIFSGSGPGYMDSLAGLVFFLLVGKWYQSKIYDQVSFQRHVSEFIPMVVRKLEKDATVWSELSQLKAGDRVLVKHGEVIPVEGVLLSEQASIDYSFITGEQLPEEVGQYQKVYTGGRQLGGDMLIKLQKIPDVQSIWNNWTNTNQRDYPSSWTNRISKYFTLAVLAIAVVSAILWYFIDPSRVPFVFSAVLIVACPCALALSAPFTYGGILRVFSTNEFYVKDPESIQSLSAVDHLVFDKTGTLTHSDLGEVNYTGEALSQEETAWVASLCSQSTHPLSQRIHAHLSIPVRRLDHFKEYTGRGLLGSIADHQIRLGSAQWLGVDAEAKTSEVFLEIDGQRKGKFTLISTYREGMGEVLSALSRQHRLSLLSGDNAAEAKRLNDTFPGFENMSFGLDPEAKNKAILQYAKNATVGMVGDGLNDGKALHSSSFGIAMTESLNGFYPGADAVMLSRQFRVFPKFVALAKFAPSVLKIGLVFSLLYNLIGLAFAVSGVLTPVVAAILMPVSSVTVVSLDTLLIRLKAKRLKLL